MVLDAGDGLWYCDARQAGAVIERLVPDAGDGLGYVDARQALAESERIVSDSGDGIGGAVVGDGGGDDDIAFIDDTVSHGGSLCATIKVVIDAVNVHSVCPRAKGDEDGGEGGE